MIMCNMSLRVCLNRSVFLLFSLAREVSPFLLYEHVLSLLVSKLFIFSFPIHSINSMFLVIEYSHTLIAFRLPLFPCSSTINCDLHGYLTRFRSTCRKCPSGINLLLVLKPRLFGQEYPNDILLTVRNSLTTTDFKKELKLYFLSLNWISAGLS